MNNKKNENRYPALKLVMQMYKAFALFLGVILMLATVFAFIDNGIGAGLVSAITSFIVFVAVYASGELLEVFLSIENNLHQSVMIQKRMLQLQQQQDSPRKVKRTMPQ